MMVVLSASASMTSLPPSCNDDDDYDDCVGGGDCREGSRTLMHGKIRLL